MAIQSNNVSAKVVTQGEAVVQAIRDVLKQEFKEGTKTLLSEEQRKKVTEILVKGFAEQRIPLKPSASNEAKLKDSKQLEAYVKGLINNWLSKSPILNGKPTKSPLAKLIQKEPAASATTPKAEPTKPTDSGPAKKADSSTKK